MRFWTLLLSLLNTRPVHIYFECTWIRSLNFELINMSQNVCIQKDIKDMLKNENGQKKYFDTSDDQH